MRNPHRIAQHNRINIGLRIDIDAAHKLHDLPGLGLIMGAGLVEVFTDKVEHVLNFRACQMREGYRWGWVGSRISNFPACQMRKS